MEEYKQKFVEFGKEFNKDFTKSVQSGYEDTKSFGIELVDSLTPPKEALTKEAVEKQAKTLLTWIHIPYLPAFHKPGWLVRYVVGPYNEFWVESVFADFWAGITVALTLIPQALSYATLANVPAINGLYCSILPSAVYTFFGSSLQLAVGPVAIVSLLTGTLVAKHVPDYATNTEGAVNAAGCIALACGIILVVLSFLNVGDFIRYISHPVMSGFTSGAACTIGLNQIKGAFGFSTSEVPQVGQEGYEYNYQVFQWFQDNWNGRYEYTGTLKKKKKLYNGHLFRNPLATRICWGTYVALIIIVLLKNSFKATKERNKNPLFRFWVLFANLSPFIAIIICAHCAWKIKHDDHYSDQDIAWKYPHDYNSYSLKIVGKVPPGLNILRTPDTDMLGDVFVDTIPLTLIAFMESYSVARKIAASRNELHILNASQELFANGAANLLACVSSAYPVSGSFSRSSLNAAAGARTPLSKIITMIVIIVALKSLSSTFQFIPSAALSAVIFAAIYNLIGFTDFWHAWKHSKKDFFTMLTTFLLVLVFDTSLGLAVGLGCSFLMYLYDVLFAEETQPVLVAEAKDNNGIAIFKIYSDITFLSARKIKDFANQLTLFKKTLEDDSTLSERLFHKITHFFDNLLVIEKPNYVDELPKEVVIDLGYARIIDITGLQALQETVTENKGKGVKITFINAIPSIEKRMRDFGLFDSPEVAAIEAPVEKAEASEVDDSQGNEKSKGGASKYIALDTNEHNTV